MPSLLDASYKIIEASDPAEELRMIDRYRQLWEDDPERFLLPRKYAHYAPVLAAYAGKPDRFRQFVRALRDEAHNRYGAASAQYENLQRLVRVLDVRAAQHRRRERLSAAAAWFRAQYPQRTTEERQRWLRKLEQAWKHERLELLRSSLARRGKRLTVAEKQELLDHFWQQLTERIERGELPSYEDLIDGVEL